MANTKGKRPMSAGVRAWVSSDRWKRIAAAQALANLAVISSRPKCGATAKHTGMPCQKPALANGRCYFHGGKTPAGAGWHKPRFSAGTTASGTNRLDRKLHDLEQARKRREILIARMTPEEREAHGRWHEARKSGPRSTRLSRKVRKQQAVEARIVVEASGVSQRGAELVELEELIEGLQRDADRLAEKARGEGLAPRMTNSPSQSAVTGRIKDEVDIFR